MKSISIKSLSILSTLVAMSLIQGCQKESGHGATGSAIEVQVAVEGVEASQQKSSKAEVSKTAFSNGDSFGMWVVPFSNSTASNEVHSTLRGIDNYVDNAPYTMANGKWSTTAEVFYPNADVKVDLYAVTPYDVNMSKEGSNTMTDPTKFAFVIKADQTTANGVNVVASDIMTAKTEGAQQGLTAPTLTFKHRMSKARISFKLDSDKYKGKTITAIKAVEICGVQLKSTVDIVDPSASPTIEALATNPKVDINAYQAVAPIPAAIIGNYVYEAIVMPGTTIAAGASVARVILTVDGADVVFDCKVAADFTYLAASQTSITVAIEDQLEITLDPSNVTITAWGTQTPPATATVKPAKMIFAVTPGGEATAADVKYAELTIDSKAYTADVIFNTTTKNLECLYRMPSTLYPYKLSAVDFKKADGTVITPATQVTLPANIVGKPFEINTYDKVIGTVTF